MKVIAPRLPAKLEDSDSWELVAEASVEKVRISGGDLANRRLPALSLDEVCLERVDLSQASLERLLVRDCQLDSCDLSAVHSAESVWQRTRFTAGRLTGWDASRSQLHDVSFRDCKLNLVNFRYARLQNVEFIGCILQGADFIQAILQNVRFKDCQLDDSQFSHAKLKNCDLRGSDVHSLRGWQHMRGAIIDHGQLLGIAPQLAADLGIHVED